MHPLVRKQMSRCPETLSTGGTRERFLPGVNGLVLLQDALRGKSFSTGVTDKRPDSGVDRLVSFQQMHLTVRLLTNGALKGFFLCFVILLVAELFVTLVAGERLVMAAHVLLQLMSIVETFVAFLTKYTFLLTRLVPPPVFLPAVKT